MKDCFFTKQNMLLVKLALLSFLNSKCLITIISCKLSSDRIDTFRGVFSFKTTIEIYEGKKLERTIETFERYSQFERRSAIHLKTTKIRSSKDQTSELTYYYDGIFNSWLQYNSQHCSESNEKSLVKQIFDEDVFDIWPQDGVDKPEMDHIVGVAKLLLMIYKVKADFKKAEFKTVRNLEAVVFKGSLKSHNIAYSDLKFEVIYSRVEMSKIFDSDFLPLHLVLTYESPQETSMIIIRFYGFERIKITDSKSANFLLFHPASNCGNSIKNFIPPEQLEKAQKLFSTVSFKAKLVTEENYEDSIKPEADVEISYAFNVEAKLIRKDARLVEYGIPLTRLDLSSTIYDFGQNKKYNALKYATNPEKTFANTIKLIDVSKTTECISSDISRQLNQNYHFFIKLDKLKYLGQTQVRGILSVVFEDDSIDIPPYWLFPSVLVKTNNDRQVIESSEFDQIVGPTGRLILVYYFTPGSSPKEMPIEKLLKVDILVRDDLRKTLTLTKEIHLFDFLLGDSQNSLIFNDNEQSNLFSLSKNCVSNSNSNTFADVAILLEPKEDNFGREDLVLSSERLFQRINREELILLALFKHFQLSRLYISNLGTKLAKPDSSLSGNLATNKRALPILKLKMRISNFDIPNLDCILLGRGRFIDLKSVERCKVVTFEECLWCVYHHAKAINKEVVFAYQQTKNHINECLIDPLYSSNSRTNFTKTLGYYPYEYGEYMMYKLHVNSKNLDQPDAQFTTWPIIRSGDSYLINQQIELPKLDQEEDLELVYLLKQVKVSGELFKREEQLKAGRRIDGIGWTRSEINQSRNGPSIKIIKPSASTGVSIQTRGVMTENLCQTMCLLDIECKSYSYCKSYASKQAACALSNIDIQSEDNANSLKNAINSIFTHAKNIQSVSVDQMGSQQRVEVRLDKKCFTSSKSYSELFRKDHPVYVNLEASMGMIHVPHENDCAKRCYEQNLDFLRGAIKQELDIRMIHKELEELESLNEDSTSIIAKLELILDWYSRNVRNLCTSFQYANILPPENKSTMNACIISSRQQRDTTINYSSTAQKTSKMTKFTRYRLLETSFYEKMTGFRLTDIQEERSKNSSINQYVHLLNIHQQGFNKQLLLSMDNVEFCARACILQTHGPKPSCASFDFVQEYNNSSRSGYCLLNSQSLHSLKRRKRVEKQILFSEKNVQYWHYEPRESFIIPTDMDDDDELIQILQGDSLVKQFEEPTVTCKTPQTNTLTFIVALLGMISGLILGTKLAKLVTQSGNAKDENTYGSGMVRLVHRLSGLSIDGRHLQNEVRM